MRQQAPPPRRQAPVLVPAEPHLGLQAFGVPLVYGLVPLVIEVMMDHPETLWGAGTYPVVK